uniref:L-lysine N6-monooxygenase MbtG n=1 Tax=Streptomyces candidus TaxID=67283 RepID=A0A516ELD1_9ACTN|nr:PyrM [Streptomyces candidus]QDX19153.1 L-lysine N6-monooxygenase [Streptomyces candidus]QER91004.1 pyfH [Streptomyces candidus]
MSTGHDVLDVVGIGIGPANLSLAALLAAESSELNVAFLDRKPHFGWHSGLMLPDAQMQVHYLKDLVTPVDPTNPFSFTAFLVATKRFYRLLVTGRSKVPRREFEQYCRWAAERIPNLRFGVEVREVTWNGELFVVHTDQGVLHARNVVSGTGLVPRLPSFATGHDPQEVFHASTLLDVPRTFAGRRVAVVGGGQSGAEVVHHLLTSPDRPASIVWGTSRSNLLPLDDSPFVDELFVPNYSRYFHGLPAKRRMELVDEQKMASDGVSVSLLEAIYHRLYDLEMLEGEERPCRMLLGHSLTTVDKTPTGLLTRWMPGAGAEVGHEVDVVICATGYRHGLPRPLHGLPRHLREAMCGDDGEITVRPDFSLDWEGPQDRRMYVQNAARHSFGVADPNLSLLAWRSATIANSVLGYERYDVGEVGAVLDWTSSADSDVALTF